MTEKLIHHANVTYADVDRGEQMLLPRIFKLLQEVAITHANRYDTGTDAMMTRGESWVLNRIAATIARYPRYTDQLRVETWSSGIKGFKGYRDFRVYDGAGQVVIAASSLWLYVNVRTKAIIRVPREVAAEFPVCGDGVAFPALEAMEFEPPAAEARRVPVSLRYSDFDVNEHVNNAAYLDLVQTALASAGRGVHPREVRLKFAKGIPSTTAGIEVRVHDNGPATRFSIEADGVVFATGEAAD